MVDSPVLCGRSHKKPPTACAARKRKSPNQGLIVRLNVALVKTKTRFPLTRLDVKVPVAVNARSVKETMTLPAKPLSP